MAETNAQKQREYRERKKLESDKFLEKERKRQKKVLTSQKHHNLLKKQLKERRLVVKERNQKSRQRTKMLL